MRDEELAEIHVGVIAGDAAALAAFESAVRPIVRGMLRSMRLAAEDADEIWNDAFLVTVQRAAEITPLGVPLRQLALVVARRRAIDRIRREARYPRAPVEAAEGGQTARTAPVDEHKAAVVQDCVHAARHIHREVMEMTSRGLTGSEIATILDLSEANAAKLRQRARAWFADCLKGVIDDE